MAPSPAAPPLPGGAGWRARGAVLALLLLLVAAVYLRAVGHTFVYDDAEYVTGNPHVRQGLTAESLAAAWTVPQAMNWHPLTILSHALDVELFGLDPGPPHLVNAALHLAASFLLFVLLEGATGNPGPSAAAAVLFAVHPLHVEPVAWITGRKDLLCAVFWLASAVAWVRYARGGGWRSYLASLLLCAAALLSKAMAVTLPFTLLLLDGWPLGRLRAGPPAAAPTGGSPAGAPRPGSLPRLLAEKIPFLALSAAFSAATLAVQERGVLASPDEYPLSLRAANALVSLASYAGKAAFPAGLSPLYPHPAETGGAIAPWKAAAALGLLVGVTVVALREARRRPHLAFGWFLFLGPLVPVLGLVQAGGQAMADRYMYLPLAGLLVAALWEGDEVLRRRGGTARRLGVVAVAAATAILAAASWRQAGYWKDGETLWRRALAVTEDNGAARNNLADALLAKGRADEAMEQLVVALRIQPGNADAWVNVSRILAPRGRGEEAAEAARRAVELRPWDGRTWTALGTAHLARRDGGSAAAAFREALRRKPGAAEGWYNLGVALDAAGDAEGASSSYREAIRLRPGFPKAWNNLGNALSRRGREEEAVSCFLEAVRIHPGYRTAWHNLALSARAAGRGELAAEAEERLRALPPAGGPPGVAPGEP